MRETHRQTCASGHNTTATLSIVYKKRSDITPDPRNPRVHTNKQIRQIARSIEAFGFNVPFLVDRKLRLISGHGRLAACGLLGIESVPTISLEHLSEEQIQAFKIADNRLTEIAEWDSRVLAEQLKSLSEVELNFDLDVTGFEVGEIDVMIEGLVEGEGETEADALPERESAPKVSSLGDIWQLGRNRLCCGNCLSQEPFTAVMDQRRAHAVFTDPPYNVRIDGFVSRSEKNPHSEFAMASGEMSEEEFTRFLSIVFNNLRHNTESGSLHFVCMDWRHIGEVLVASQQTYTEFKNLCVWVKDSGGLGSLYRSQHELVFVFKSGTDKHRNNIELGRNGRYRTNVWSFPRPLSLANKEPDASLLRLHPTIKPVAMVADAILDCTARGEIVLDPFVGSGTTLLAAERVGRIAYGIELDPDYVDLSIRRWQTFTGKSAVHVESGRTFRELEEERA
jgi:DNA modification methylase